MKKNNLKILSLLIIFVSAFYFLNYNFIFAKSYELSVPLGENGTITTVEDLPQYISTIFQFGLGIAGLLALALIVYGAIQYTTSAGNVAKQQDAKDRITSAIYGLVLLLGAYLILNIINPELIQLKLKTIEIKPLEKVNIEFAFNKLIAKYAKDAEIAKEEAKKLREAETKIQQVILNEQNPIKKAKNTTEIFVVKNNILEAEKAQSFNRYREVGLEVKKFLLNAFNLDTRIETLPYQNQIPKDQLIQQLKDPDSDIFIEKTGDNKMFISFTYGGWKITSSQTDVDYKLTEQRVLNMQGFRTTYADKVLAADQAKENIQKSQDIEEQLQAEIIKLSQQGLTEDQKIKKLDTLRKSLNKQVFGTEEIQ